MPSIPRSPTIIVMGGGGFLMEPDNPRLDRYILAGCGPERPKICFLPTASGDRPALVEKL